MARKYSVVKKSRRLGIALHEKASKALQRRPYPPGAHGKKFRRRPSDYGLQLAEKQKAKFLYGLREKQFVRFFKQASKTRAGAGSRLLELLERRLDNVLYRANLVSTRPMARQIVSHGNILVNKKKLDIPSYLVKENDKITFKNPKLVQAKEGEIPQWLNVAKDKTITIKSLPQRVDIGTEINEQLIVEFYSR